MPALVITLGTLYIYRGINVAWAGSDRINASDLPADFLGLGTGQLLGIPILTIIAVVVLVVAAWFLRNLRSGRELYAIGSDPAAAHLYGLHVTRRVIAAFVVAARSPASAACSSPRGTAPSAPAPESGGAAGHRRGRHRRRRDLGRSRHGLGRGDRRVPAAHDQPALPILGIEDFWQRAVVGVLILGSIVLDRVLAVRQSRRLIAQREVGR